MRLTTHHCPFFFYIVYTSNNPEIRDIIAINPICDIDANSETAINGGEIDRPRNAISCRGMEDSEVKLDSAYIYDNILV